MDYFKVPSHTSSECATLSNAGTEVPQIYIYRNSFLRLDTYTLINYKWVLTNTQTRTNNNPYQTLTICPVNDLTYYVPVPFSRVFLLAAILCGLVLSVGLFKVFKR